MIPMFKVATAEGARDAVATTLFSGMLGEGPRTEEFVAKLQKLFDQPRVLALNSCTSALALACRLADTKGCEIYSTAFTMIATNTSAKEAGGSIVWGDADPKTLALDLDKAKNFLNRRPDVRVVMLTLVGGIPPHGLDSFFQWCDERGTKLILDCAHALNSTYKGRHVSHYGHISCLSFQAIKHLQTADGGAIVFKNQADYERAEKLKWFGMTRKVPEGKTRLEHQMTADVEEAGYKIHMNDIAASIGLANFDLALKSVERSRLNASALTAGLVNVPGLQLLEPPAESDPAWWVYGFLTKRRAETMAALVKAGIVSTPMWRPNNLYSCFQRANISGSLDGLERIAAEVLFVPNGWWVSDQDIEQIIQTIKKVHQEAQ